MTPTLQARLCTLRPPALEDAGPIFANYASDPEVTRYLSWPTHTSPETTAGFLQEAIRRAEAGQEWAWCICGPGSDECIGMVSVIRSGHKGELGYVLGRRWWGGGVVPDAAAAVMRWCFHEAGLARVWATCAVANAGSSRVLQKLGMQREGVLRGWHVFPNLGPEARDCYIYSRLAEDG